MIARRRGGTGLGLTIASRLVILMGGRLELESEPGRGSASHFTVTFGLGEGRTHSARRSEVAELPEAFRPLRVLVVEDTKPVLHATVYRMDAFRTLITQAHWDLPLPLRVRGIVIDEEALLVALPLPASAGHERTLRLATPRMRGDDVKALQQALIDAGFPLKRDRVFGPATDRAVRAFQEKRGLKVDGLAGPATRSALRL